jgi:hypothetical protein
MKHTFFVILLCFSINSFSQQDVVHDYRSKAIEIKGTEYLVTESNVIKKSGINTSLDFINTISGEVKKVELPPGIMIQNVEQVQIPELGINKIIVTTVLHTSTETPVSSLVFILSHDGSDMTEIDPGARLIENHTVNTKTGKIVFFIDARLSPGLKDAKSADRMLIFDLKTLKKI